MHRLARGLFVVCVARLCIAAQTVPPFPAEPEQQLERTCFQTSRPYTSIANLRSDVAIVYGIDAKLPERMQTWRDRGYRIHVMTGVAWGRYEDYLSGRFDGVNHEDEKQTDRHGNPHRHGNSRDVFYLCPGTNYGKFLCVGIQRALDAGADAIHLEEPEFWVQDGYEEAFKREWRNYYGEDWQPPHSSVDAQWRASKLKYFLYRRALQQVFDYVRAYNQRTGCHVRCYVPTHSLLNYAHWRIVSPESSLTRLEGCDGYIAQVWTGTARTPNLFRGQLRERTFETAFLEYGAMQNLVRATGRAVWYLNDPVEDNPNHDWADYQRNWESTLVASLFQPEVCRYEVAPWPERVFGHAYPSSNKPNTREQIPSAYATELLTVMNALNDMNQRPVKWDCGTTGSGVVVSDSLMFERGEPNPSDAELSHFYGLSLPLLKRGMPITPVQLENLTVPHYLDGFQLLLLTYQGMKPLSSEVHKPLVDWVKSGGVLLVCDDDSDPYNRVREWWNSQGRSYATPREHLFEALGINEPSKAPGNRAEHSVGKGAVIWMRENPARLAGSQEGDSRLTEAVKHAAERAKLAWRETNYLLLRRGRYVIGAGIDESLIQNTNMLRGRFVNLFDPELRVRSAISLSPGSRFFLLDLEAVRAPEPKALASACKALFTKRDGNTFAWAVEGVADTPAIVLLSAPTAPRSLVFDNRPCKDFQYSSAERLLWIRFTNDVAPRELRVQF
jgi:hypothetical protein